MSRLLSATPPPSALALALVAQVPFAVWLVRAIVAGEPGAVRAAGALGALILLAHSDWRRRPCGEHPAVASTPSGRGDSPSQPLLAVAAILLALLGATVAPALFGPSVAATCLVSRRGETAGSWPLLLLALLAQPVEIWLAGRLDHPLQVATTLCAAPLLHLSGLPVTISLGSPPVLVASNIRVAVSSLCAGAQTFVGLLTLALVLAEVTLRRAGAKKLFVALALPVGFAGNLLRVVASSHAASLLGGGAGFALAHDLIGYASFTLVYGALLLLLLGLRRPGGEMAHPDVTLDTHKQ